MLASYYISYKITPEEVVNAREANPHLEKVIEPKMAKLWAETFPEHVAPEWNEDELLMNFHEWCCYTLDEEPDRRKFEKVLTKNGIINV